MNAFFTLALFLLTARANAQTPLAQDNPAPKNQDNVALLKEIRTAWQARQDMAKSIQFTWDHQQTRRVKKLVKATKDSPPTASPNQWELISYPQKTHFSTEGERVAYYYKVPAKHADIRLSMEYKGVFNGRRNQRMHFTLPPNVMVSESRRAYDVDRAYVLPILFAYRALRPRMMRIEVNSCVIDEQPITIAGHSCWKLTHVLNPPSHTRSVWVATDMDYSILRYTDTQSGTDIVTIDINYSKDKTWGWVPTHWEVAWVFPNSREISEAGVSDVTSYELNVAPPAGEFQVNPPPGSIIHNQTEEKRYVVLSDGSHQEFTSKDLQDKKLRQLIESESDRAEQAQDDQRWQIWLAFAIAGLLFVAIVVYFRLKKKHDS